MKEINNAKQNCDHTLEGILMGYNGQSSCANCGKTLSGNQITILALKGKLLCQDMIEEKRKKNAK